MEQVIPAREQEAFTGIIIKHSIEMEYQGFVAGVAHSRSHAISQTLRLEKERINRGMPLQVLKTILGHSSLAMTADLYSHLSPDTKREEMKKIVELF